MMDNGTEALPRTFEFRVGDAIYRGRTLTVKDALSIQRRIQDGKDDPLQAAIQAAKGLDVEVQKHLVEVALRERMQRQVCTVQDWYAFLMSIEGLACLLWHAIHRDHAETTEAALMEEIAALSPGERDELENQIQQVLAPPDPTTGRTAPPAKRTRSRSRSGRGGASSAR